MPQQGNREPRHWQWQRKAVHAGEQVSGMPFMNCRDDIRSSGQGQRCGKATDDRNDLSLESEFCQSIVDVTLVTLSARNMDVSGGCISGRRHFPFAQRVPGSYNANVAIPE